jgi:predicted transcriptional regulator
VLADDSTQTVPPHEHVDQVKSSWLDPSLRNVIQGGGLSDPVAQGQLGELRRTLVRVTARLDTTEQKTGEVHDRITAVTTTDLARQSEIAAVRNTVSNFGDRADEVLGLRTTLESVRTDVQTAITAAQRLVVDGQPVDFNAFDQRLKSVEQIGVSLRTPSGALLDAAQLENRLTQLTNTLVTQAQLEDVLSHRPANIPQATIDGLQQGLRGNLKTDLDAATATLATTLQAQTTERLAGINAIAAQAVADALPGLQQSALATIRPEIEAAATKSLESAQAAIATAVAANTEGLRAEIKGQLQAVQTSTAALIGTEITRLTAGQLTALGASITELQTTAAALGAGRTQQDAALQTLSTRVEQVARDGASTQADLRTAILAELTSRFAAQTSTLDARLTDLAAQQQQRLDASIGEVRRTIGDQITTAVTRSVADEVRKAETRINASMVTIAHDQIAAVQDQLQTSIKTAVTASMQSVPGVVSAEVLRQTATMPDLVKAEVARTSRTVVATPGPGVITRPDVIIHR